MIIDINTRCCIESDPYQWMVLQKKGKSEKDWRRIAFFRTLDFALDALIEEKLCAEPEVKEARVIAHLLESTKRRVTELLAGRHDASIPAEVAGLGSFMTAAGAINYWFLKRVWEAESASEIPALAGKAVSFAESQAGNATTGHLETI